MSRSKKILIGLALLALGALALFSAVSILSSEREARGPVFHVPIIGVVVTMLGIFALLDGLRKSPKVLCPKCGRTKESTAITETSDWLGSKNWLCSNCQNAWSAPAPAWRLICGALGGLVVSLMGLAMLGMVLIDLPAMNPGRDEPMTRTVGLAGGSVMIAAGLSVVAVFGTRLKRRAGGSPPSR